MRLTLRARSLDDQPLPDPPTAHFDMQGGTIGRSSRSHLTLPDPGRHVSRHQARIVAAGSGFAIRNIARANPISVRGQVLRQDEWALLRPGDDLRIGGYRIEVTETGDQPAIEGLLDRFAPARLEAEFGARSGLLGLLPMLRRARLWSHYARRYEALRAQTLREFERLQGEKASARTGDADG